MIDDILTRFAQEETESPKPKELQQIELREPLPTVVATDLDGI